MSKRSSSGEVVESEKKSFEEPVAAEVNHAVDVQKIVEDKAAEKSAETKPVLYHIQHWSSSRPLIIMHELGLLDKIDIKVVSVEDIKKEDFLALNPHGTVRHSVCCHSHSLSIFFRASRPARDSFGEADRRGACKKFLGKGLPLSGHPHPISASLFYHNHKLISYEILIRFKTLSTIGKRQKLNIFGRKIVYVSLAFPQIPILKMPCGKVVLESGAMAMHLVEKYGGLDHPLFGKPENRLEMLQWLFYAPSTLYPMVGGYYITDEAGRQKLLDRLNKQHLPFLAKSLGDKKFLCGDEFTLADAFMGYELAGLQHLKWLENFPTLDAYVGRLMQRPSFAATFM